MMKKTEKGVGYLVEREYEMAAEEWGEKFASLHEGAAVLREEIEEATDEGNCVDYSFSCLWDAVKANDTVCIKVVLQDIYTHAILGASEMIQVAAMAMKILATLEQEGKDGKD